MEFLVRIEFSLPPDMAPDVHARLLEQERARGLELRSEGVILRIWRIPGRRANVGIWQACDATVLHDAIASLPLFPWIDAQVTPLALHPVEGDRAASGERSDTGC
jgi:muconolactone D-isomerase